MTLKRPSTVQIGWLAIRPKTLTVSIAPVITANCLAYADTGAISWLLLLITLVSAMLIQIGTNLFNDVGDFLRGADGLERLGPLRATSSGWLAPAVVQRAAYSSFALATLFGGYLVWHGGWPILLLGLAALASGWAYTCGPRPVAYSALGEVFVWLFFGLAAVIGSYYLQTFQINWRVFMVASLIGFQAAAVIVVNNYRDLDCDQKIGKMTLAVCIGRFWSKVEYGLLMLTPFVQLSLMHWWLPLLALPWSVYLLVLFCRETPGPIFNRLLAQTAQLQLLFSLLLSASLLK